MTIGLQTKIVYGPLRSRRFGVSLGINLLPQDQKICNFDCIYCQYSRSSLTKQPSFPTLDAIQTEASLVFSKAKENDPPIDWITIAGNGEPTLHPHFGKAVACLLSLRDKFLPDVPVGILSNSSTCYRPEIRQSLALLDGRFMKLDAGSSAILNAVNQPSSTDGWGEIVAGLCDLRNTVLQSLFFEGEGRNVAPTKIQDWIDVVGRIRPRSVQIYTVDRPTRLEGVQRAALHTLRHIAGELTAQTGIPGEVF